jgi:hypothetical protein
LFVRSSERRWWARLCVPAYLSARSNDRPDGPVPPASNSNSSAGRARVITPRLDGDFGGPRIPLCETKKPMEYPVMYLKKKGEGELTPTYVRCRPTPLSHPKCATFYSISLTPLSFTTMVASVTSLRTLPRKPHCWLSCSSLHFHMLLFSSSSSGSLTLQTWHQHHLLLPTLHRRLVSLFGSGIHTQPTKNPLLDQFPFYSVVHRCHLAHIFAVF